MLLLIKVLELPPPHCGYLTINYVQFCIQSSPTSGSLCQDLPHGAPLLTPSYYLSPPYLAKVLHQTEPRCFKLVPSYLLWKAMSGKNIGLMLNCHWRGKITEMHAQEEGTLEPDHLRNGLANGENSVWEKEWMRMCWEHSLLRCSLLSPTTS